MCAGRSARLERDERRALAAGLRLGCFLLAVRRAARSATSKMVGVMPSMPESMTAAARPRTKKRYTAVWPGAATLSPLTTGPTGTNGGANEGTGPLPSTAITICDEFQMRNASDATVAMASCSML